MRQPRGMDQALDTTRGLGDALALRRRFRDGTGVGTADSRPSATLWHTKHSDASSGEARPGGRFDFRGAHPKKCLDPWASCL